MTLSVLLVHLKILKLFNQVESWTGLETDLGAPGVPKKAVRNPHVGAHHGTRPHEVHQEDGQAKYEGCALGVDQVEYEFDPRALWTWAHDGAELEEYVRSHCVDPEHEGGEGVEDHVASEDTWKWVGGEAFKVFAKVLPDQADVRDEIVDDETESDLAKEGLMQIWVDDVHSNGGKKKEGGDCQGHRVEYEGEILKINIFFFLKKLLCPNHKFAPFCVQKLYCELRHYWPEAVSLVPYILVIVWMSSLGRNYFVVKYFSSENCRDVIFCK